MPVKRNRRPPVKKTDVKAQEALDMFTVKRKQGKPTGQYESRSSSIENKAK